LVGFKSGIGLVIAVDQVPKLLGIHFAKGNLLHNVISIADHLLAVSLPTMVFALVMLAIQLGLQRFLPRVPASLVTVATGIAASAVIGLDRLGVELVGPVQGGLPAFARPDLSLLDHLWAPAAGVALMSFVETVAAGRAFQTSDEPRPDANRELLALGLTNVIGGLFHTMPSGGGTSQTAVNSGAGARSQIAGVMTAAVVVAVLSFLAPVVRLMPQATLAAVVVVSCLGMVRPKEFRTIRKIRGMEFSWAVAALAAVMILGTLKGIVVAVILSLLALLYHANRRPVFVLGRKPGTHVFRPQSKEHPEDETFPGLLLLKTEGIIHFANAQRVGDIMWRLIREYQAKAVVIDCSAIPDLEYSALRMLIEAEKKLRQADINLSLAGLNPEPLMLIQKTELGKTLGRPRMHFNLEQAIHSYQKQFHERQKDPPHGQRVGF
jgi:MFS superfamily sulfate permease-like transporter